MTSPGWSQRVSGTRLPAADTSSVLADATAPLGGHLVHVIVLAAWLVIVAGVLLVDHLRGNRWRAHDPSSREPEPVDGDAAGAQSPTRVSMATWPPRGPVSVRPAQRARARPAVVRSAWLATAVIASLLAAGVHVIVMPEHFDESAEYGAFFAVAATAQIGYALLVAWRPSHALLRTGIAGNASVVALWAYTRFVEVPLGPGRGAREEIGGLDLLATGAELAVVVGCVFAARVLRPSRPESPAIRPPRATATVGR